HHSRVGIRARRRCRRTGRTDAGRGQAACRQPLRSGRQGHLHRRTGIGGRNMTTDRMATRFAACKAEGRAALVTFVTAGDPTVTDAAAILDALVAGGADVIELGMPFTDPMADGPAIELANLRSLGSGTKTKDIFAIAAAFRARHA